MLLMPRRRKAFRTANSSKPANTTGADLRRGERIDRADLIALFRLLLREPPDSHDFKNCPTCRHYRITRI